MKAHGGRLAAEVLKASGTDAVFTLSGGHLFPLYDGAVAIDLPLVDVRHEQSAVFAAEGLAKVSRRAGVAALTAGPGVTNGVSAITSAHFTGSPVVVLGGRAPAMRWGQGSLQELDHVPIVDSVTRYAATSAGTAALPEEVRTALLAAARAHRGPSFLDVPMDVMFNQAEVAPPAGVEAAELETQPADPGDLDAIAERLAEAERPVLMVGADLYWERGEEALSAIAEACNLPVFMNGLGRGLLAADHANAFSRCRRVAFGEADLVVVVGTPLDFRLGFGKFGTAEVVHVMDTKERLATHVDLVGSAAGNLAGALAHVREACLARPKVDRKPWIERLRDEEHKKREAERAILTADSDPIHPGRVYGELAQRVDRDAIVIGDGGDFVSYAGKYVDSYVPGSFLDPGPYGCLGTGPGYAIGARTAFPDRQIVLMLGDGAAGFALSEFDTMARLGLDVVVVMGNNGCWGLEKHPMQQLYGYHVVAELDPETRYDQVVEALGGAGRRVTRPGEVGPSLDWAFDQRGPVLVEVMTDPEDAYPRSSNLG